MWHYMWYPLDKFAYNPRQSHIDHHTTGVEILPMDKVEYGSMIDDTNNGGSSALSFNWIFHFNYDIKLTMRRKASTSHGSGLLDYESSLRCGTIAAFHGFIYGKTTRASYGTPLFWYDEHMCSARRMNNWRNRFPYRTHRSDQVSATLGGIICAIWINKQLFSVSSLRSWNNWIHFELKGRETKIINWN